jgi:hypothetical protein
VDEPMQLIPPGDSPPVGLEGLLAIGIALIV